LAALVGDDWEERLFFDTLGTVGSTMEVASQSSWAGLIHLEQDLMRGQKILQAPDFSPDLRWSWLIIPLLPVDDLVSHDSRPIEQKYELGWTAVLHEVSAHQWLGVKVTLLYSLTPSSAIKVRFRKASLLFSIRFIPEEMSTMPKLKSICCRGQRMKPSAAPLSGSNIP
jgi:hypothetical protein